MLETITTTVIAELAFKKFLESGAGELGKQFTTAAISKMDELRQLIWNRLKGNHKVEAALTAVEDGNKEELNRVSSYLQVEMDKDDDFAGQVQQLAQEINNLRIDNQTMTQNNYDHSTGYQTDARNATNYFGGTHNHGITQNHSGDGDNIERDKINNNFF